MDEAVTVESNDTNSVSGDEKYKKTLKIQRAVSITICGLLLISFIVCYVKFGSRIKELLGDEESLKQYLSGFNGYDKAVFVLIRAFQTVVKIIPAQPLEIGSGYLWGTWVGFGLCMLGTLIGSFIILLLTRLFGQKVVELFIPMEKVNKLKIFKNPNNFYAVIFIIFLIPSTPKDLLTYVAGISKVDLKKFLIISMIARIPSLLASTWCGSEIGKQNFKIAIVILIAITLLGIAGSFAYKKYQDKSDEKTENESEEVED